MRRVDTRRSGRSDTGGPSPLFALVAGTGGLVFGFANALWDFEATAASKAFLDSPEAVLWLFLFAAQPATCAIVAFPVVAALRSLWRPPRGRGWELALLVVVTTVILAVPVAATDVVPDLPSAPLAHFKVKATVVPLISYATGMLVVVAIWLVYSRVRASFRGGRPADEEIAEYLRLRAHLQRLLAIGGVLIGEGVFATGALGHAIKAATGEGFAPEYVLLYGGYFTAFLAVFYVPIDAAVHAAGRRVCDAVLPMPPVAADEWSEWYKRRQSLEEFLGLRVGTVAAFRAGVAILTPLTSAVVSLLLSPR